jgi:hypothetical protein
MAGTEIQQATSPATTQQARRERSRQAMVISTPGTKKSPAAIAFATGLNYTLKSALRKQESY